MSITGHANITGKVLLERALLATVTTFPCCIFFSINLTMLFTLRSKAVFRDSSRYILLYNLLFADTVQMCLSQLLYLLSASRIRLTYPVCGLLVMLANFTNEVSPLTLVVMSMERYVAVCHPLRHATIVTIRSTAVALVVVLAICTVNVIIRVLLLLDFPFEELETLQMNDFCGVLVMLLGSLSEDYNNSYTGFLFLSATLAIGSSYLGVMVAARSASTDKASAHKARKTLLLQLVQLGLSLLSTVQSSILGTIARMVSRSILLIILNSLYVLIIMLPRCLSSLIYGLGDQTIRPVLLHNLSCRLKIKGDKISP